MSNNKNFSGSILVYSLLILSIMVMLMLGVAQVTMQNKKTGISTKHSDSAMQTADSGVETFINEYKTKGSRENVNGLMPSQCRGSTDPDVNNRGKIVDGNNIITLLNTSGDQINCYATGTGAQIKDIKNIKSVGEDEQQNRAVKSEPPCTGVEFDPRSLTLYETTAPPKAVSFWPLTSNFTDLRGVQNALPARGTSASAYDPVFENYNGRDALRFNGKTGAGFGDIALGTALTDTNDNHNYAKIPHNDAYKLQNGTVSLWVYGANNAYMRTMATSTIWVGPFSKDQNGCCTTDATHTFVNQMYAPPSPAFPTCGIAPYNLGYCDSGSPATSDSAILQNQNRGKTECDCGHLSFVLRKKEDPSSEIFWRLRHQNEGNFGGYKLNSPSYANTATNTEILGAWHMLTDVFDSKGYAFYYDDQLVYKVDDVSRDYGNLTEIDGGEGLLRNIFDIWLGKFRGAADEKYLGKFQGAVRGVRIYNQAFSKCQVGRLYRDTNRN